MSSTNIMLYLFFNFQKVTPTHYNKFYVLHLKPAVEPLVEFAKGLVKKELGERVSIVPMCQGVTV